MTDEKRQKVKELRKYLAGLNVVQRQEIADKYGIVTVEGHRLSIVNMCLLVSQCPGVTVVGGYRQWLRAGRQVRKGEHGHIIWFPAGRKDDDGNIESGQEIKYYLATVFDVSQTDPVEVAAAVA